MISTKTNDVKPLSKRQVQILQLFAYDGKIKEIAVLLGLHPQTVSTQVDRIRDKLHLHTYQGMVAWAFRNGIIK